MTGRHADDAKPTAGRTPAGKRGAKPKKSQAAVQSAGGAWLWKQIADVFGSKPKKK